MIRQRVSVFSRLRKSLFFFPAQHLCSSVDICCFHSPSHGGEEAMCVALCCLHKTSISSSLFSTACCIIFCLDGSYQKDVLRFFLLKNYTCRHWCLTSAVILTWREALSVAPSVDSYLPQKHKDTAAASLEEGIKPRQGSSCKYEGDPGHFATVCYLYPSAPLRM